MRSATEAVEPIPPRKKLTKKQRVAVFDRANGICWICERKIDATKEKWEAEHPHARGCGGSDKPEDLKPAHVDCHKPKTAEDKAVMAKTTRVRAGHLGVKDNGASKLKGRSREEIKAERQAKVPAGRLPLPARKRDVYGREL